MLLLVSLTRPGRVGAQMLGECRFQLPNINNYSVGVKRPIYACIRLASGTNLLKPKATDSPR